MAVPFTSEQAPLIRGVLIHKPHSAVLIMIAHHAIADGMALVFLIRDLLQVLSGGQIEALSFSSTAEELLSKLPKRGEDCCPSRGIASRYSSSRQEDEFSVSTDSAGLRSEQEWTSPAERRRLISTT
jgi:hypothetical protein